MNPEHQTPSGFRVSTKHENQVVVATRAVVRCSGARLQNRSIEFFKGLCRVAGRMDDLKRSEITSTWYQTTSPDDVLSLFR
jgi:hypothetical protein